MRSSLIGAVSYVLAGLRWSLPAGVLLGLMLVDPVASAQSAPPPSAKTEPPNGTSGAPKAPEPRFDVMEYRVLGNTVLPSRDIETVLYPLLGHDKQLKDVEAARGALEKLYHDRGFATVFIDIPPQDTADGIVRLRVTEGRVHERKIDGAKYFSERDIDAAVPAAAVGTVPNLPALQKQLADVNNQTPDRSVVPILKQGPEPGTMDLELKVTDKLPLHFTAELDDNYTVDTKPLRANVGLSYSNLFAALDSIAVNYQDSPQETGQVSVFSTTYTSRPIGDGYRLSGSFINSNSNVANIGAGATGVLGKGQIYSLRLAAPTYFCSFCSQSLSLGLDYKHFRDVITIGGGSAPLVTPISYTNLSLTYAGTWRTSYLDGVLTITPDVGLRGAPNSADAFENKRYLGRPNYAYVRWDGSLTGHLPGDFRLTLRLAGQDTTDALISNEEYSIGGSDVVRGFLEVEELGDVALKGTVQFQTPTWSLGIRQLFNVFTFFDDGKTHVFAALSSQPDHAELRSWGAGLNLLPGHAVNGVLTWAEPLTNGSYTRAHQSRLLFIVTGAF